MSEKKFYTQSPDEVLTELATTKKGLTSTEAQERLAKYGKNELDAGEKKTLLAKFLEQFKDLMIIILMIAAILSVVTSGGEDISDAIIIMAVVIINAVFGVYQEGKAEAAIDALKSMSTPSARVRRDGHVEEISSDLLVPGDVVSLEAGDVVPADMRLLEVNSLKIEEAALTGESVPVEKDLAVAVAADAGIGDRVNMAYQNSNVTYGRGLGVIVATGMTTEVGKIASMLQNAEETDTPLKQNLNNLSKILTYAILLIAAVTFVVGVFVQGHAPLEEVITIQSSWRTRRLASRAPTTAGMSMLRATMAVCELVPPTSVTKPVKTLRLNCSMSAGAMSLATSTSGSSPPKLAPSAALCRASPSPPLRDSARSMRSTTCSTSALRSRR